MYRASGGDLPRKTLGPARLAAKARKRLLNPNDAIGDVRETVEDRRVVARHQ